MDPEKDEKVEQEPEGAVEPPADGDRGGGEDVRDGRGQPGINREKYRRDIEAKDKQIAELQAQLDEKSQPEAGRAELKAERDRLKADMADERTAHQLNLVAK